MNKNKGFVGSDYEKYIIFSYLSMISYDYVGL